METQDIDMVVQRTYRYWYEDGLTEIGTGCLFILIGLLFLVESILPVNSPLQGISAFGLPVLVIGGMWVGRYVLRALKSRLTYPRTGYVAYRRQSSGRRWSAFLVAGGIGALVAVLFIATPASLAWIPLLDGVAIAIVLLFLGYKVGLIRFYILAAISALAGAALSLSGIDDTAGTAAYFAGMGVALVASGVFALRTYLAETQPPVED